MDSKFANSKTNVVFYIHTNHLPSISVCSGISDFGPFDINPKITTDKHWILQSVSELGVTLNH